jgi:hypothetical protein
MFHGRPSLIRLAAVAAAGASCLAAAACGTGGAPGVGAAASPGSTADPLAGLSAGKVNAEATANAEAAPSLTIDGTISESGKSGTVDLAIKRGQGCKGTIGTGEGSLALIMIGNAVYMNPDKQFWTATAGAKASELIALIDGRYIELPASDKSAAGLATLCNVSRLLTQDSTTPVTFTKEPVTSLGGTRVLPLELSDGSTEYVTDTSKPEFVKASAPKGSEVGLGNVTLSVGVPVTLTAPPASQVINGTTLGM